MSDKPDAPDGFLARWSRRKVGVREGAAAPPDPSLRPAAVVETAGRPAGARRNDHIGRQAGASPATGADAAAAAAAAQADAGGVDAKSAPVPAAPTLDDVAALGRDADFHRFVAPDVAPEVKNAAMKKLFTDPHFNVMDGLDTYIDDYGKPDPIPASMLRQLVQSHALGLFADEPEKDVAGAPAARASPDGATAPEAAQSGTEDPVALAAPVADDHHPALRLQPLDAAGPPRAASSVGQDPGRER